LIDLIGFRENNALILHELHWIDRDLPMAVDIPVLPLTKQRWILMTLPPMQLGIREH
jgi:hypothetical protein